METKGLPRRPRVTAPGAGRRRKSPGARSQAGSPKADHRPHFHGPQSIKQYDPRSCVADDGTFGKFSPAKSSAALEKAREGTRIGAGGGPHVAGRAPPRDQPRHGRHLLFRHTCGEGTIGGGVSRPQPMPASRSMRFFMSQGRSRNAFELPEALIDFRQGPTGKRKQSPPPGWSVT